MSKIADFAKKYSPGFKQFIYRTIAFLIAFIALSFILGKKAYYSNLLYGFNFWIYGGMGYIILFSIIGFVLLYKEKLISLQKTRYNKKDILFILISLFFLCIFYVVETNIDKIEITFINVILVHTLFLSAIILLIIGIYGAKLLSNFIKKFRRELAYFLIFGLISYSLMAKVWSLWPYLSRIVSSAVYFLLNLISKDLTFRAPDILIYNGFAVKIGEPCSGIYSIFLFTGLYLFITLIDWKKLNKIKVSLLFIPAILGAFIVNILRVFLLMIVGAHISKEAALGLYHSYTGMIFFMIYFILFWLFSYKWMKKR